MNVRCSDRGSFLGIKIYSPSSECLIESVDIPEKMVGSELNRTQRKRREKTRGEFSSRFFFLRQFFSRVLLSERDRLIKT